MGPGDHHGQMPTGEMSGSANKPPPWTNEWESWLPFKTWIADVVMWSQATNVDEARKGPLISLSLGGIARELAREIPIDVIANGAMVDLGDGNGPQQLSGTAFLLHTLSKRFAPLVEETNLRAMAGLYGFA